ncbi:MAG: hypothetical protein II238_02400 [Alphaproteobacteria bacterium]|jgi:hypothetical protein|nr:hypothetical protein [Alphaproteobacteria bacterium]
MSEEKRDDFKDAFNTALLCGFVFIVVGHLHSFFDGGKIEKSNKTTVTKDIIKTDSVQTDSVSTLSFVQEKMRQQKTK